MQRSREKTSTELELKITACASVKIPGSDFRKERKKFLRDKWRWRAWLKAPAESAFPRLPVDSQIRLPPRTPEIRQEQSLRRCWLAPVLSFPIACVCLPSSGKPVRHYNRHHPSWNQLLCTYLWGVEEAEKTPGEKDFFSACSKPQAWFTHWKASL